MSENGLDEVSDQESEVELPSKFKEKTYRIYVKLEGRKIKLKLKANHPFDCRCMAIVVCKEKGYELEDIQIIGDPIKYYGIDEDYDVVDIDGNTIMSVGDLEAARDVLNIVNTGILNQNEIKRAMVKLGWEI
jgi:hypothetical protein